MTKDIPEQQDQEEVNFSSPFPSKISTRYRWSEIQSLVKELAQLYQQAQKEVNEQIKETERPSFSQSTTCSRVLREEKLRSHREGKLLKSRLPKQKVADRSTKTINLKAFKDAWAKQHIQQPSEQSEARPVEVAGDSTDPLSKERQTQWDLEQGAWVENDKVKEATELEKNKTRSNSFFRKSRANSSLQSYQTTAPTDSTINPWEQLLAHFLELREKRLVQEAKQAQANDQSHVEKC